MSYSHPQAVSSGEPTSTLRSAEVPGDRRRFPRYESGGTVRILPAIDRGLPEQVRDWMFHATRHLGRVIDISLNGIAFASPEALSRGHQLWLRIENRSRGTSIDRAARVVRSVRTSEGMWKTMCRFRECLSITQLQSISRLMS